MTNNVQLLHILRLYIKSLLSGETKELSQIQNLYTKQHNSNESYDFFVQKILEYTYNEFTKEDFDVNLNGSFTRLIKFFETDSTNNLLELDEEMKLDISDLFLILEIIDDEVLITGTTEDFCCLFKNKITGKYESTILKERVEYSILKVINLLKKILFKFNSFSVYSKDFFFDKDKLVSQNNFLNRFIRFNSVYKIKPIRVVNKIHLKQIQVETQMTYKRCWELMFYYKIIGIIKALFLKCNNLRESALVEVARNEEQLCIVLFHNFVNILKKIQESNYFQNNKSSMICLQSEFYEFLRDKFPYNLAHCLDNAYYWDYFDRYLTLFCNIQLFTINEISFLIHEVDYIFNNHDFNSFLSLMDFIFNRIFILINSIEIKHYSDLESNTNYISSLYILIIDHFYSLLLIETKFKNSAELSIISIEVNIMNWVKLIFSSINNINNTLNGSLEINRNCLVPDIVSKSKYFKNKFFNGCEVICYGLKMLYQLLKIVNINTSLQLTNYIFKNLNITHYLLSIENNCGPDISQDLLKMRRLLNEVIFSFTQQISIETLNLLFGCREIDENTKVISSRINELIVDSYYII